MISDFSFVAYPFILYHIPNNSSLSIPADWTRLFREKCGMDQKSDNEWKNDLSNDTMRQDPNDPEEGNENE